MTLTKGDIALSVVCVVAGILLGAGFRSCSQPKQPAPEPIVIHDTLVLKDTADIAAHTKEKGVVRKDKTKLPKVEDEAVVSHSDSADLPADTSKMVEVEVPITAYEYRDTFVTDTSRIELGIRYEGYRAKIDGIDLYSEYLVEPPAPVVKKKGFGSFAGISTGPCASVIYNPITGRFEAGIGWSVQITLYGWGYHW